MVFPICDIGGGLGKRRWGGRCLPCVGYGTFGLECSGSACVEESVDGRWWGQRNVISVLCDLCKDDALRLLQ